ncbi:c-type cytochrome [Pedobacter sp. MC2016-24]|uniref:c-type cytochrome n=1 Tax=Pedobacter sp. MC2016-24 TaxID=2780090 RepID=UPI0018822689|nr:c-type cytochrome [Pedobacter sp. MC2016-24]MBE9602836.1 c-type cytochrome [Pedobacter sp. MC2016-24]
MKSKLFILSCLTLAMAACGSPEERASGTATTATTESPTVSAPATTAGSRTEGEKLIAKSDCIGCHNKVQKVIGPAYVDIAKKYPLNDENVNHLADKIISGGKGVWGEVPMTPHANMSKEEAKEMVTYILSLK